jgi:hypothetical protein
LTIEGIAPEGGNDAGADSSIAPGDGAAGGDESDEPPDARERDTGVDAGLQADADAAAPPLLAQGALQFDGLGSYVRMPRPVADDFTLEAWIRTTVSGPGPNFWDGPPVFHADINGPNSDFGSSIQNGKFAFGMGSPDLTVVGAIDVATGEWVHIAVTRVKNSGTVTIFVNGVQDTQRTNMSTSSLTANPNMDIGANFVNAHYFSGTIDEVRAWNIVRTASDIQATMRKPLTGNEQGLVGYWRFDETTGDSASDSSPGHHAGSLDKGDAGGAPTHVLSTAF